MCETFRAFRRVPLLVTIDAVHTPAGTPRLRCSTLTSHDLMIVRPSVTSGWLRASMGHRELCTSGARRRPKSCSRSHITGAKTHASGERRTIRYRFG